MRPLLPAAALALLAACAPPPEPPTPAPAPVEVTTASSEAYEKYTEARRLVMEDEDRRGSIARVREALAPSRVQTLNHTSHGVFRGLLTNTLSNSRINLPIGYWRFIAICPRKPDGSDRFLPTAPVRPCYTADGDGDLSPAGRQCAGCHLQHHLLTDRTVIGKALFSHPQHLPFRQVGVGDKRAIEP